MRSKGVLIFSQNRAGERIWRAKAANGHILAGSTEGYARSTDARAALVTSTAIQFAGLSAEEQRGIIEYATAIANVGRDLPPDASAEYGAVGDY